MIRNLTCSLTLFAVLGTGASTSAAVPGQIHYQGTLRDAQGELVHCPTANDCPSGPVAITFRMYTQAEGGDSVWEESWDSVPVSQGAVDVRLGSENPIEPAALGGAEAYLALSINGEAELEPRQRVVATAYSLVSAHAMNAESLGGQAAEAYVTTEALPGLCVTEDALLGYGFMDANAVDSYLTENGFVPGPTLSDLACAPNEGPVWSGNEWVCALAGLAPDAIAVVSNGLISNQFVDTFYSQDTPMAILDNNPGGSFSELEVPDVGKAQVLTVSVKVSNSDFLSLKIILYDALNQEYVLFNGDNGVDGGILTATYPDPTPTLTGDLTNWVGENPAGMWRLEVIDNGFVNNGIDGAIEEWSVQMQTLSNQKVEVKGDLIVSGTVTGAGGLDIDGNMSVQGDLDLKGNELKFARLHLSNGPPAPCSDETLGMVYLDTAAMVIKVCIDGEFQSVASGVCGDGKIQGAEDCDDGNALNGDGCNASCQVEAGYVCTSLPSKCAAKTCLDIKAGNPGAGDGVYFIDPNGGDPADAFMTFCNMSSPHGAPDYKLITPDQFYHGDNFAKYGPTNGINVFDYGCDFCGAAQVPYDYYCPDENWEVSFSKIRSHCDHSTHDTDSVFTQSGISSNGVQGRRYQQINDNCGDPNEFTIVGVCKVKGTQAQDPGVAVWETHFKNVNWSN